MNISSFWAIFTSLSTIRMNKVGYARRCKPGANIMNKKLFMAHKSAKTFFFKTFFFIMRLNHGTNFFWSLDFKIPQKDAFMVEAV